MTKALTVIEWRVTVAFRSTRHKLAGGGVVGVVAREVDPLGVPELVAHEVEVALAAQRQRDQPELSKS